MFDGGIVWRTHSRKRRAAVRHYTVVDGMGSRELFAAHNGGVKNLLRAIVERVFLVKGPGGALVPPLQPRRGAFGRLRYLADALADRVGHCRKMTVEEFIETSPAAKRSVYVQAAKALVRFGVSEKDAIVGGFVKYEKLCFTEKEDPVPRLIQPRKPKYNIVVGRWIRPIERKLYPALDWLWGRKTVMKGLNASGVASALRKAWDDIEDPVAIPLDAKRFDQHVSEDALRHEHRTYNRIAKDPELAWGLAQQLVNKGRCVTDTHDVTYEKTCRASGDMNTGVGNCSLMVQLVFQFCREMGLAIPGSHRGRYGIPLLNAALINNGDDCTLIVPRRFENAIRTHLTMWFANFGFDMEMGESVSVFEEIEFCQAHPVECVDGWRMVRNLDALSKDCLCLRVGLEVPMWMRAVGEGGMALAGCVPIYSRYYRLFESVRARRLKNFRLLDDTGFMKLAAGMERLTDITPRCRASFYSAFGISPDEQLAIENQYQKTSLSMSVTGYYSLTQHRPRVLLGRQVTPKRLPLSSFVGLPILRHVHSEQWLEVNDGWSFTPAWCNQQLGRLLVSPSLLWW